MEFRCRLGTADGDVIESVYVAETEAHLRHELEHKGLCILSLRPRRGIGSFSLAMPRRRRLPSREFLVFNQELATLLKAGMPLVQSLDILRARLSNPLFKSVLDDVYEKVRAGSSLSEAFATHAALFPGVYTASLMAGEKSGSLETVLRRYVAYMKIIGTVKRRTAAALVYPAVLVALSLIVVSIIVLRVVPEFSDFYASFGKELPPTTKAIVAVSLFARNNVLLIALAIVVVAGLVVAWLRKPRERQRFDRWVLRIPAIGTTVRKFVTAQMARTLATLLGGGIPLVNAVEITARSVGNRYMAAAFDNVGHRVREGESFSTALNDQQMFPPVAIKMAEVGESTGALGEMLNSLADFYDEEIETDLARFVTLIEPALLVIMGLVIASLLLALYMPLFQLSGVVSQ
ncbi:MAG: type II secretion system F family protein [Bacteroidales bacterium]